MELVQLKDARRHDHCLAVAFFAPRSFTGEDVVEFHLHGGLGWSRALGAAYAKVRGAEPGEFTQRAYLSSKLDLVEAGDAARVQASERQPAIRSRRCGTTQSFCPSHGADPDRAARSR